MLSSVAKGFILLNRLLGGKRKAIIDPEATHLLNRLLGGKPAAAPGRTAAHLLNRLLGGKPVKPHPTVR